MLSGALMLLYSKMSRPLFESSARSKSKRDKTPRRNQSSTSLAPPTTSPRFDNHRACSPHSRQLRATHISLQKEAHQLNAPLNRLLRPSSSRSACRLLSSARVAMPKAARSTSSEENQDTFSTSNKVELSAGRDEREGGRVAVSTSKTKRVFLNRQTSCSSCKVRKVKVKLPLLRSRSWRKAGRRGRA